MLKQLWIWTATLLAMGALLCAPAIAQDDKFTTEQLDQMLAPIALYPDDLLTNVLMGSTYPLDVVAADRWRKEAGNAKLKGDALTKALEVKDWDPSVKALVQFPQVLATMSEKLDWTQKLGDAFLGQQSEVMDEIQLLRRKADEAGNLKSTTQQKVVKESGSNAQPVYIIEPATPETVYVPVYQPAVVYGSWWYPSYPPYYWPYPTARFVNGFFWGTGVAVATGIWGWNHCDWHHHDIDIDVNKWNNINVNRDRITNNKWEHNAAHRGPVPYKNKEVRDKFAKGDRRPGGDKDFRGFDRGDLDRSQIQAKLRDTDHSQIKDKIGDRAGNNIKGKVGGGGGARIKDRAGDRPKGGDAVKQGGKVARDIDRPKPRKAAPGAFDVKRGADAKRFADRGRASRVAMQRRPSGGRIGGGHRAGGGRRR